MDTILTVERTPREYEVLALLSWLEKKALLNSTYFMPRLNSIDEVNGIVQDIANIKLSRVFDDWQAFVAVFNEAEEKYPESIYCSEWREISERYRLKL
ncbi:protein of unknown function [Shewanella benthica]|uniref:Uncharacterized protein n=1 Tax=Shewanella benthica TaxID=43661 RepID=A0A330M072_9GAMM|nr:hypothetical protein [Shewanella benthica]SQH75465.1 protein of unknown function [Shewanella benthica]